MVEYDLDKNHELSLAETKSFYHALSSNRPDLGLTHEGHHAWFNKIDADHDGTITKEELRGYLVRINYTHHHNYDKILSEILAEYDLDHNDVLSLAETKSFYHALSSNRPDLGLTYDGHHAWFNKIDDDHDGTITK